MLLFLKEGDHAEEHDGSIEQELFVDFNQAAFLQYVHFQTSKLLKQKRNPKWILLFFALV
jgi:hypothetical protein